MAGGQSLRGSVGLGGFLDALSAEDRTDLRAIGQVVLFKRGQTLFNQGDASDRLAVILTGRVKVVLLTEDGDEVVLAIRGPNQTVGELAALDGEPRSATVVALEPVEALVVAGSDFHSYLQNHSSASTRLAASIGHRMRDADSKRVEWAMLDASARLAHALAELADEIGERNEDGTVTVPLAQQDVAGCAGMSREAANRGLRVLRERGLVTTTRRRITILEPDGLRG